MKISCQSCAAKYTIADEKVVGKVIKIKCKKCGATIVVNGNDPAALAQQIQAEAASFDENASTQLFAQSGAAGAGSPDEWTVSVTDEDQRTMTTQQVVQAYADGTIATDTFVWKDGMADWLPLAEVPELATQLAATGANGGGGAAYAAQPSAAAFPPGGGAAYETTASVASPVMPAAAAPMAAAPMPAARRAGGRGNVDLFGSRDAGGAAAAAANAAAQNIGERNESSVLFSLSALTAAEDQAKKPEPVRSSFQMSNDRVDDILSLGGGMGTAPMLAPPPMNAPIIEAPPPPPMSVAPPSYGPPGMGMASAMPYGMQQPQKKASPVGFIVGGVGLLAAVGVMVFFLTRGNAGEQAKTDSTSKVDSSKEDDKKPVETAKPVVSVAMTETAKVEDTAKAADTAKPDASADPKAAKDFQAAIDAKKNDPKSPKTDPKTDPKVDPKAAKTAEPKVDPKTPDPTPPAGGGGEFDRGAASAQLSAKAGGASGCKKPDGPTGSAKVQVTFAPSGKATQATVGAPFAGTPVGSCIASLFKSAAVPPFSGAAMTVSKTVSIK